MGQYRKTFTYDGQRYDIRAKTQEELWTKVANKKRDLEEAKYKESNMTYAEWIEKWLTVYKEPSVSAVTYRRVSSMMRTISKDIGYYPLKRLTLMILQEYINELAAKHTDGSMHMIIGLIRESLKAAKMNRLIQDNPSEYIKKPKCKEGMPRRSITAEEREAVLKVAEWHRGGLFIKIMLYCGLRPGEAMALTWDDIDFKARTLSISKSRKVNGELGKPKTKASNRLLPIPSVLIPDLEKAKAYGHPTVSTNIYGRALSRHSVETLWSSFKEAMEEEMGHEVADDLQLYCFRHTFCTDLEKKGVPINVAKALMGHSSLAMTSKIYTHYDEDTLELARKLIDT